MATRLNPALIRAARGLLNWSVLKLAEAADLSVSTVKRMEMTSPQPVSFNAYAKVRAALIEAGVDFLDDKGQGVGVRFRVQ